MPLTSRHLSPVEALEPRRLLAVISGFSETEVAEGLSDPTAMAFAPDGRLFVAEQGGAIKVLKNGEVLDEPFFTVPTENEGERGLVGITLDPAFAENGFVYVYYFVPGGAPHNRIARLTASGDRAAGGSLTTLVDLDPLNSNALGHNGGAMHFADDGTLLVAVGDNTNPNHSQTLSNRHGKMLRYNRDGSIPSDNPFASQASGANRAIWALGLRNPFTFAVSPDGGRVFVNDVGQDTWEEINEGAAGANYGWPAIEGERTNQTPPNTGTYTDPLHAYRNDAESCAITGGAFYAAPAGASGRFPGEYAGDYFFADLCGEFVRRLDPATGQVSAFASDVFRPVDIDVAPDGSLYVLTNSVTNGRVTRFRSTQVSPQPTAPAIEDQPESRTVPVGDPVSFTVGASGTGPLQFQWQRNGQDIPGATGTSFTIDAVTADDDGDAFRAVVSNAAGEVTSAAATLTVTQNRQPIGTITAPAGGSTFAAGETIQYAGTATDLEDGTLPASAFSWRVEYHTGSVARPLVPETPGSRDGSFVVPTVTPYTQPDVFFRIHLTVTDEQGLTHTSFRDVTPRTSQITLSTEPAGLALTLDGQPAQVGSAVTSVEGLSREIAAPATQLIGGVAYEFVSWSDGGAASHAINVPADDATYTATYRPVSVGAGPPVSLAPAADAMTRDGKASTRNFGRQKKLRVAGSTRLGRTYESILLFDLSAVETVTSAKLTLFGRASGGGRGASAAAVSAFGVEDLNWTETGVTMRNRPPVADLTPLATVSVPRGKARAFELDLSAYLQARKAAGATQVAITLASLTQDGVTATFASRESKRNAPRLVVTQ